MKARTISYWTTTVIVVLVLASGGVADLLHPPEAVEGMTHLGYPVYFMTILGVWKILGAIALAAPRWPRLKEWAYAGALFDFTGAAASHLACGDDVRHVVTPLLFALLALASWALRPAPRVLGTVVPARAST